MASLSNQPDDARARAVIDRLQKQFRTPDITTLGQPGQPAGANNLSAMRKLPTRPLLGTAVGSRFAMTQGRIEAVWKESTNLELSLPARSIDAFRLRDRDSGVTVTAKLAGARNAPAAVARGMAVYDGAGPTGGAIVHRLTDAGTEDWVTFETRPDEGRLTYDVSLAGTAGLRLVGNTLEFVDRASTPRLRISPPYVVGKNGAMVEASLSVSGCAVDHDPSAPWDRATVPPGSDRCRVDVRWDVDAVEYPAIVDPSWSSTGSMSTGRAGPIGAAINTNRVLVAGGIGPGFAPLATAELYDPTARTWAATASMSTARSSHAAAVRGTGSVLVTGGFNSSGTSVSSAETYLPSTGAWTTRASMNKARAGHRLTTLSNGDVLVTGGTSDGTLGAQRFSNSTATWSSAGNMLSLMSNHTATLMNDGRVLVAGEANPSGESAMLFQPSNNTWSMIATQPQARTSAAAVRLADGKVLLAGGSSGSQQLVSAELFDPATASWSQTGGLWQGHVQGAAVLLNDNRVLLFGNSTGNSRTIGEIYDPTWGTWRPAPPQTQLRNSLVAVRMQNDRVLIAAGTNNTALLATATEFIPTTTTTSATEYKIQPAACTSSAQCSGQPCVNGFCVDTEVMPDMPTELWSVVYRPSTLPSGRLPLIIFLHGNHGTCGDTNVPREDQLNCQYTTMGTCPANFPIVSPSHLGYEYMGRELASRGYLVVSINANRGVNCGADNANDIALILARGRLIMRHLEKLSRWNRGVETTPASIGVSLNGKLDLTQVGLMGHSRGGEGIRAAMNIYKAGGSPWPARIVDPVTFRGLFEIGPTQWREQVSTPENALNTAWSVLLPMCDGDVAGLEGGHTLDRMMSLTETTLRAKSTYTVWGANHNYYNTQWQVSEGFCANHTPMFANGPGVTGSAQQRGSGLKPLLAFFTANVGNTNAPTDSWFNNLFNPESTWNFFPRVDRGYAPSAGLSRSTRLEDFLNPTGTSSYGKGNNSSTITIQHTTLPQHDSSLRGAEITWSVSGGFFQTNFTDVGSGLNLSGRTTLDLRVDRADDASLNTQPFTEFTAYLVNANDTLSDGYPIGWEPTLTGPAIGAGGAHSTLQTARIPLSVFSGANLASIRAVRLVFNRTPSGHIFVANIRASNSTAVAGSALVADATPSVPTSPPVAASDITPGTGVRRTVQVVTTGNRVVSMRPTPDGAWVEIEVVTGGTKFSPRDARLELQMGGAKSLLSGSPNGDLSRVIFTMDRKAFDAVANGATMTVRYVPISDIEWSFGALDKSLLTP